MNAGVGAFQIDARNGDVGWNPVARRRSRTDCGSRPRHCLTRRVNRTAAQRRAVRSSSSTAHSEWVSRRSCGDSTIGGLAVATNETAHAIVDELLAFVGV